MRRHLLRSTVASIAALASIAAWPGGRVAAQGRIDAAPASTLDAARRASYNLDNAEALAFARRAVKEAPLESTAHRTLASILWLNILFRRGAITVDHYLDGSISKSSVSLPKPPG